MSYGEGGRRFLPFSEIQVGLNLFSFRPVIILRSKIKPVASGVVVGYVLIHQPNPIKRTHPFPSDEKTSTPKKSTYNALNPFGVLLYSARLKRALNVSLIGAH